jgi:hypothetical protein
MKFTTKIATVFSALGLATVITLVAATLAVAQPSEVWVDDDYCNGCSNESHTWDYDAFDNIQDGIDAVASPGTVYVGAGIYEGKVVLKTQVTLLGSGIGVSIIDGMWLKEGDEDQVVTMASGSKLSGFSVINGGGHGVLIRYAPAVIEGNLIAHHEEIGIALGYNVQNTIVKNNFVTDCASYGGIFGNTVVGSPQIINNTVVGNTNGIGFWYRGTPIIKNNIIVNNKESGIVVGGNSTYGVAEPVYSHNNVWDNTINWNDLEPGEGAISENPLFVNESGGDYHLQKDSPCIDAGTDVGLYNDIDGDVRPFGAGFDMGADEFVLSYIEVDLDIKPGSYPNSINLNSKGKVTVAILTTDDFNANDVDPVTCEFAGEYPLRWKMEDVDYDGDYDMLFHFMTQELELKKDSTEATLECETFEGIKITGTDSVNIVPKGKVHSKKAKKK